MRVQLVDPRGDVTPYDHALSAALARRGAQVELVTSRFLYGPTPEARGYAVNERFYRRAVGRGVEGRRSRRALRVLEHVPDMLSYRRHAGNADVRHFQWLPLEAIDAWLIPNARPRVMTLHNVIRRGGGPASAVVTRRLAERMDAVVVHTSHGKRRLEERLGVDAGKVRVIPHGAFEHLTRQRDEAPLPEDLARVRRPVVLCFGTLRPYKGVDVLLDAFREVQGAELWIVGRPLDDSIMAPLHERAGRLSGRVRFVTRYVTEAEIPAFFRRADLVALPHRSVDQSGVLYIALPFGKPLVISAVGGFEEVAEQHGAARLVQPGEPEPLAAAINELLADPEERARLGERAAAAAAGPYSWERSAAMTMELYEELLA